MSKRPKRSIQQDEDVSTSVQKGPRAIPVIRKPAIRAPIPKDYDSVMVPVPLSRARTVYHVGPRLARRPVVQCFETDETSDAEREGREVSKSLRKLAGFHFAHQTDEGLLRQILGLLGRKARGEIRSQAGTEIPHNVIPVPFFLPHASYWFPEGQWLQEKTWPPIFSERSGQNWTQRS